MEINVTELNTRPDKRKGYLTTARFDDRDSGKSMTKTFKFKSNPTQEEKQVKFDNSAIRWEFKLNPMNDMIIEGAPELRIGIQQFVTLLRNDSKIKKNDLVTAIDTAFPDSNWKPEKLIDEIMRQLNITLFDELINFAKQKKFSGVDE